MSPSESVSHPYFPRDAAIPHYVPNTTSLGVILLEFAGLIVVFVASGVYVGKRNNPSLRAGPLKAMAWFLLCRSPHVQGNPHPLMCILTG